MGWVKDARPCLNVSAFFGGGTHLLAFGTAAAEQCEAGGAQSEAAPPGLAVCFISRALRNFWMSCYHQCYSSTGDSWWEIAWFLPPPLGVHAHSHSPVLKMRSSPLVWVIAVNSIRLRVKVSLRRKAASYRNERQFKEEAVVGCGEGGGVMCFRVSEAFTCWAEICSFRYLPQEGPRNRRPSSNFSV